MTDVKVRAVRIERIPESGACGAHLCEKPSRFVVIWHKEGLHGRHPFHAMRCKGHAQRWAKRMGVSLPTLTDPVRP